MSSLFDTRQCSGKCGTEINVDRLVCQRCWLEIPVQPRNRLSRRLIASKHTPPWQDPALVSDVSDAVALIVQNK